jgi:hypothetical protein
MQWLEVMVMVGGLTVRLDVQYGNICALPAPASQNDA